MPVFGLRLEKLTSIDTFSFDRELKNRANKHLIFDRLGNYNLTYARILLPRVQHILTVYREKPYDPDTMASYVALNKGVGNVFLGFLPSFSRALDLELEKTKGLSRKITAEDPMAIGTEETIMNFRRMYTVLMYLYVHPNGYRDSYESSIPEPRQDLLADILELLSTESLDEVGISKELQRKYAYYREFTPEKIRDSIRALIDYKMLRKELKKGKWVISAVKSKT
ncbi:hypothetical protein KBD71_03600 [Candidatus Woesebacteria bacterium]|nr:hypothetical protein [Candidatus Woesebacteria bacterium]